MYFLHTLVTQIATATAVGFAYLGHAWLTVGWGLHPLVAGVIVAICLATPHVPVIQEETS